MRNNSYNILDDVKGFERVLLISYSPEISLKGKNRGDFVSMLKHNIISRLKTVTEEFKLVRNSSRFLVYLNNESWENKNLIKKIVKIIRSTFGVSSLSFAYQSSLNIEDVKKISLHLFSLSYSNISSFKVSASRSNKDYYLKSPQINEAVASTILNFINEKELPVKVKLKHPDLTIYIEVSDSAFVFIEKIPSVGGLPLAIQGEVLFDLKDLKEQTLEDFILSAFLTLRRGIKLLFINSSEVNAEVLNEFIRDISIFLLPNKIEFVDSYNGSHFVVESIMDFPKDSSLSPSKFIFPLLSDESFLNKEREIMKELIFDD